MYRSMSSEETFSKRVSGPGTSLEVGNDGSASFWISLLSAVSRPAWSLFQKYLPGRSQTWSSEAGKSKLDFGQQLMTGLDELLPSERSSSPLSVAYVHCQHGNGVFVNSGDAESLRWLTGETLRELGIQDTRNTNCNAHQSAPMEFRYLASTRKFLSQVLNPKEGKQTEAVQHKLGIWYHGSGARASNTWWWWQGLWRSEDPQNSAPALYQTRTCAAATGTKSLHCGEPYSSGHCEPGCQRSAGAVDKPVKLVGHSSEAEWTCSECAGPSHIKESADHTGLHTERLEFLPNSVRLPSACDHSLLEHQIGTGAPATCSEVPVLTPDQDNGYSSLEEEGASARQHNMNAVCELSGLDRSAASQAGDHGHGGEEDKSTGNIHCKRFENKAEDKEEEKEQNTEPVIVHEAFPVQSTPYCQNKVIAYIMGSPCSDESDMEDSSVQDSDEDDDGFDSDILDSCSDSSENSDDSDDEDEEDEEDSESDELDSESERLWNSLCQTRDPYNLRNFTAPIQTSRNPCASTSSLSPLGSPVEADSLLCSSPLSSPSPLGGTQKDMESSEEACSSMDEAESLKLWNSFSCSSDPYSPLNFQASVRTLQPVRQRCKLETRVERVVYGKEEAEERMDSGFSEAATVQGVVRLKKVTFTEEVEEFYASSDEERRGPWEEYARDRCRFQRRVQEVEESISYCLSPSFRLSIFQRLFPSS
ncbi:protein phosphatase 1 regulatory subunit 15B, partial [Silurus meridionalis]